MTKRWVQKREDKRPDDDKGWLAETDETLLNRISELQKERAQLWEERDNLRLALNRQAGLFVSLEKDMEYMAKRFQEEADKNSYKGMRGLGTYV